MDTGDLHATYLNVHIVVRNHLREFLGEGIDIAAQLANYCALDCSGVAIANVNWEVSGCRAFNMER